MAAGEQLALKVCVFLTSTRRKSRKFAGALALRARGAPAAPTCIYKNEIMISLASNANLSRSLMWLSIYIYIYIAIAR